MEEFKNIHATLVILLLQKKWNLYNLKSTGTDAIVNKINMIPILIINIE